MWSTACTEETDKVDREEEGPTLEDIKFDGNYNCESSFKWNSDCGTSFGTSQCIYLTNFRRWTINNFERAKIIFAIWKFVSNVPYAHRKRSLHSTTIEVEWNNMRCELETCYDSYIPHCSVEILLRTFLRLKPQQKMLELNLHYRKFQLKIFKKGIKMAI